MRITKSYTPVNLRSPGFIILQDNLAFHCDIASCAMIATYWLHKSDLARSFETIVIHEVVCELRNA